VAGRRLTAGELAEAAVLGDLALVLALAGWFLPFGFVLFVAASVPYAALRVRRRLRAVVISVVATSQLAFLLGGVNLEVNVAAVALIGACVGGAYRRGWGRPGTLFIAVPTIWAPVAVGTDAFLFVFRSSRELALAQIDVGTAWARKLLHRAGDPRAADAADRAVVWMTQHWYLWIPCTELALLVVMSLLCRRVAVPALRRLDAAFARPAEEHAPPPDARTPAPVPVRLRSVGVTYPGRERAALAGVDVDVEAGTFVVVVGPNGSGKSTLGRVLAGRAPTEGTVERPGSAGLGLVGGTAAVFQRPESQVLGVRVSDDLRWGVDVDDGDIASLLDRVGLRGFEGRETATLSGGELQRLAIAAALARRPALLLADEATAMLDPAGRRDVVAVLHRASRDGIAVVLVTHHAEEAARADVVVALEAGRVVAAGPPAEVLALADLA